MSDDSHPQPSKPSEPAPSPTQNEAPRPPQINSDVQVTPEVVSDRAQLLERARNFLHSPQVRNEDNSAKYRFLAEKGLNEVEIRGLLHELPTQAPVIPPRTYPQPPPSNLPALFIGVARILSWVAGGSLAVLLLYFRYIYPRLAQSYQARLSLRNHQKELLTKLTSRLTSIRAEQKETFAVLPTPNPYHELPKFANCHSLDSVFAATEKAEEIPPLSLLRCAFEDLEVKKVKDVTGEILFETLEEKSAWIASEEGAEYARRVWDCLNTTPIFEQSEADGKITWSYTPPTPPTPPPLFTSLTNLKFSLPQPPQPRQPRFQHTMQALSDFTGYIATQTYAVPSTYRLGGSTSSLPPEVEEARREIRALKGLVLNRRSFMPPPKPTATEPTTATANS